MIIHTTAPLTELAGLVGARGNVTAGTAIATGGPDCFAGWFEPAVDDGDCRPNNIVTIETRAVTEEVAQEIWDTGCQIVVTGLSDAGDDVVDPTMPYRYEMSHTH